MASSAQRMVVEQLIPHGVTDERVLRVMAEIPREEFLTGRARRHAYEDRALAIGCGQTISQPLVVALMTQSLNLTPESIALEVGTGSGYQAAILSRLCRRVITVEREAALAEQASAALRRLGFANVEVAVGDGSLGWPADAPYDAILVACAATQVPPPLIEQLAEGGRLVVPVQVTSDEPQDLRLYVKSEGSVSYRSLFPVLFVPLRTGTG
ncbi:MAG TPA: protein-L-isoaspartate(D-aspartate) O-methyltransferase [Candidatus Dormibacteraeota bacterium]|nr:protein-L-isoaspartate(D-aspartate) O-methyltransferase [Candidatus Dormibacteraeota bacterium]